MDETLAGDTLKQRWNAVAILMSIGIAFLGSYGCITLYEQFRLCSREHRPNILSPRVLLFLMTLSLGGVGIWCMHFIGMSALSLYLDNGDKVTVEYRIDLTVTSLVAVLVLTFAGIYIATINKAYVIDKTDVVDDFIRAAQTMTIQQIRNMPHKHSIIRQTLFRNLFPLVLGGVLTAAGVCVMHYIGMTAIVSDARIRWSPGVVAASVLIAMVAATAAYWILFRLLAIFPFLESLRVSCAIIMAIAVNGMHYTGMAAATWYYEPGRGEKFNHVVSSRTAQTAALDAAIIFICAILIASLADIRVWYYNLGRVLREVDRRLVETKQYRGADADAALVEFMGHYERLRNINGSAQNIHSYRQASIRSNDKSGSYNSKSFDGSQHNGTNGNSFRSETNASSSLSFRKGNTPKDRSRTNSRVVPVAGPDHINEASGDDTSVLANLEIEDEKASDEPVNVIESKDYDEVENAPLLSVIASRNTSAPIIPSISEGPSPREATSQFQQVPVQRDSGVEVAGANADVMKITNIGSKDTIKSQEESHRQSLNPPNRLPKISSTAGIDAS